MRKGARALEFAKDGFFVGEEVADEAVGMAFMHGEWGVVARAEDAWGEVVGEGCNEGFVGGSEFYEAGEVRGYSVQGCDVGEAKLAEGVLKNRNAG